MGIVVPETCWAYKKYNKIISGIKLVFYSSVITMMHGPTNIKCYTRFCKEWNTICSLVQACWVSVGQFRSFSPRSQIREVLALMRKSKVQSKDAVMSELHCATPWRRMAKWKFSSSRLNLCTRRKRDGKLYIPATFSLPYPLDRGPKRVVYRGAGNSIAGPWTETSCSDQDLQHHTKTYGVQIKGIYCCYLFAVRLGMVL